jgi:hypothetical protein
MNFFPSDFVPERAMNKQPRVASRESSTTSAMAWRAEPQVSSTGNPAINS